MMDTWVVSTFWVLWVKLWWMLVCKYLFKSLPSVLWALYHKWDYRILWQVSSLSWRNVRGLRIFQWVGKMRIFSDDFPMMGSGWRCFTVWPEKFPWVEEDHWQSLGGGVSGSQLASLLEAGWWEGRYRSRKTSEKATTRILALTGMAAVEAGKVAWFWIYIEGRAGSVSDGLFVKCRRKSMSNHLQRWGNLWDPQAWERIGDLLWPMEVWADD